ncbi:MAG: restriction endonuclease subunit S [Prevotella sp.]|nr:restriction endonuclease subunit S [Prevotella sp.]
MYSAFDKLDAANELYQDTEYYLSGILGLDKVADNSNINIESIGNTFIKSGRLDAEYYRPQYGSLFGQLGKFNTRRLGELVSIHKSIEPGSNFYQAEGIPFVRVADFNKFGISESPIYLSRETFAEIIRPKKDTILMSKDGSVGIAYKVEKDKDVITSSAILHLRIRTISVLPDYLTTVLNSKAVQLQAERDAGGSIIQHWKPSEIENVIIPVLSMDVQEHIAQQVQESFRLRRESQQLLETAKRAVEVAISEKEESAFLYIGTNKV